VESQHVGEPRWQLVRFTDTFRPGDEMRVWDKGRVDVARRDQWCAA
jgi:hypothetical protein